MKIKIDTNEPTIASLMSGDLFTVADTLYIYLPVNLDGGMNCWNISSKGWERIPTNTVVNRVQEVEVR